MAQPRGGEGGRGGLRAPDWSRGGFEGATSGGGVGQAHARFDSRAVLNLAGGGGVGFGMVASGRQIVGPGVGR